MEYERGSSDIERFYHKSLGTEKKAYNFSDEGIYVKLDYLDLNGIETRDFVVRFDRYISER